MFRLINGFKNYLYNDIKNIIYNINNNREVTISYNKSKKYFYCKMKSDDDRWKSMSLNTIKSLSGLKISLNGYYPIPKTNKKYFINKYGSVISFAENKFGKELKIQY